MTMSAEPRFGLFNTAQRIVHSVYTQRDYQVGIWFPFSYAHSTTRYPVLYVLDGDYAFGLAVGVMPTLIGAGEAPEVIVVGIAYDGLRDWSEHALLREQDFCPSDLGQPSCVPKALPLSAFLQHELFPLVERDYRGLPEDRALFGFSAGGLYALQTLFVQPGLLRRCVAASCTWPGADDYLMKGEGANAAGTPDSEIDLFLAVGGRETEQLEGFGELAGRLSGQAHPHWRVTTTIYDGEGHGSGVLARSFVDGVRAIYRS